MNNNKNINPNILLTEVCNMACPYCFAKETMVAPPKKEMSYNDFQRLLVFLRDSQETEIRLMGGEPTLHSQFKEIINLAISYNFKVKIFTNGFFSEELARWMTDKGESLKISLNVTAIFFASETIRKSVIKNIDILKDRIDIFGSVTIDKSGMEYDKIINFIKSSGIKIVRIGLANNRVNNLGNIFSDYEIIIKEMMEFINKLRKVGIFSISLNCGFTPCMFTYNQLDKLTKERVIIHGWGCAGKVGGFDISSDLSIFSCFIMEDLKMGNILNFLSLKLVKNFSDELNKYLVDSSRTVASYNCKKCPYFLKSKCDGPCLGYIVNNKENRKKLNNSKNKLSFKLTKKMLYWLRNIS